NHHEGQAPLARYHSVSSEAVGDLLMPDELAAALLWADAEDIHCPGMGGPGDELPDSFYVQPPLGPGDATTRRVDLDMSDPVERAAAVSSIRQGNARVWVGLLPCLLATLLALVQLLFSISLIIYWAMLPLGLLLMFFQPTAGALLSIFRGAAKVIQITWSVSL